ncbi:MAG: pyruvate, water dikinase regulatory protein [Thermodesulfobacteriota bacterium]
MNPKKKTIHVFVISDATGLTAERVIRAVLVQFSKEVEPILERRAFVKTPAQLEAVFRKAQAKNGVVIYSLVDETLRRWIAGQSTAWNVESIDLLGPILERMMRHIQLIPLMHPGLLERITAESLKLAESIDYTLRHDDGLNIETLGRADLILLGVSRTSKTPTSLFLSCNFNLKVANVPIVLNVEPPRKIFTLTRPRLVGLLIKPERLATLRRQRYRKRQVGGYYDPESVHQELAFCQNIYRRIGNIQVIDVTNNTIEETANQIMKTGRTPERKKDKRRRRRTGASDK